LVQDHAVYAGMVEAMDQAVGKVLAAIDDAGVRERTLVIFTSDNGGLSTSEGHPTSNLPLRGGKGWLYEGGIRVPFIVRWPGTTKAGAVIDQYIASPDVFPTLLEAAGLPQIPHAHKDGVSFLPLLKGGTMSRGAIYWHYPHYGNQGGAPGGAVREGDWKLIEHYEDGRVELFNVREELSEKRDLAPVEAQRVKELRAKLAAWREDVGAKMPAINPKYDAKKG
jgi:arylsulfatase A-like enzyme